MKDTILILILATSALVALPSSSVYEDTTIPSYDTTWTENGDRYRQIYICDRKERTETVIIIRNDSVLLRETTKF
ncbi:MAG: hypothetical protein KIH03_11995 [Paludibacteraceae bacterium]|nr:hypothetical protein [Paludibacteraceae bacterium]